MIFVCYFWKHVFEICEYYEDYNHEGVTHMSEFLGAKLKLIISTDEVYREYRLLRYLYAPGDDCPHRSILILLCLYVCYMLYICVLYLRFG